MLETMIQMIVDQSLLGLGDRLFHRLELLDDVQAGALALDHLDHRTKVPLCPPQAFDDGRMGRMLMRFHEQRISPSGGQRQCVTYPPMGINRHIPPWG